MSWRHLQHGAPVLGLAALLLLNPTAAMAESEPTPGQEISGGALSVGTGALALIASPLAIPVAGVNALVDGKDPSTAGAKAGLEMSSTGAMLTGMGVVFLVDGTGRSIAKLSTEAISATSEAVEKTANAIKDNTPRVTVSWPDKAGKTTEKTIPLVVRPQYVQMNEKLEDQPCQHP